MKALEEDVRKVVHDGLLWGKCELLGSLGMRRNAVLMADVACLSSCMIGLHEHALLHENIIKMLSLAIAECAFASAGSLCYHPYDLKS